MNLLLSTLKKILFWSYDRGTWQYDVLCVLILAFAFLTPNGPFRTEKPLHGVAAAPLNGENGADRSAGTRHLPYGDAQSATHENGPGYGPVTGVSGPPAHSADAPHLADADGTKSPGPPRQRSSPIRKAR